MKTVVIVIMIAVVIIFIYLNTYGELFEYDKCKYINGIKIPEHIRSDHQKFALESIEMINYMDEQIKILNDFHIWTEQNNVVYTLTAGSLIGQMLIQTYLPWDDDIDLYISNLDWKKIDKLWENGEKASPAVHALIKEQAQKTVAWYPKIVTMNKTKYILLRYGNGYKLIDKLTKNMPDIGGIDIICPFNTKDGVFEDFFDTGINVLALGTTCDYTKNDIVNAKFAGITVKVFKPKMAKQYLEKRYGKDLFKNRKLHPAYFAKKNN